MWNAVRRLRRHGDLHRRLRDTCPKPCAACTSNVTGGGDAGSDASTQPQTCGDSKLEGTETCDDGNVISGDGCSATCQTETGFACPLAGQPCKRSTSVCGNGIVESGEQCDDGNAASNHGCSSTCQLEAGYTCPTPGAPCTKAP